jgi:two-component system sensor histidine kinase KdpD
MRKTSGLIPAWPAAMIWAIFAAGLFVLDGWWSLGNLGLLLVLGSTLASYWLTTSASVMVAAVAVAGFNWFFVEPRYTFHVQLDQDLLLLITMLGTSALISVLTSQLRQHALLQTEHARQAERLQQLGTELQHASTVDEQIACASRMISAWIGLPVQIWLQNQSPDAGTPLYRAWKASQQEQRAIGPGTGRYESLDVTMLPMRSGVQRIGTLALGPELPSNVLMTSLLEKSQSVVRLLADEIQRMQFNMQAREAQERLQSQQLRNTLLAAISHDYRTPLATITGAASGLLDECDISRVKAAAKTILQESEHLHRVTTNTLQMARLDTANASFEISWESVEELCGAALSAARRRHPGRILEANAQEGLPLLQCDPILIVQLLDNLLENALRYSPAQAPVILEAHWQTPSILLRVLDRGIGIPEEWKERVFDPFRRVLADGDAGFSSVQRRGMGLGLALCRSIARVHYAKLWIEDREGGGTAICIQFPIETQPALMPDDLVPRGQA